MTDIKSEYLHYLITPVFSGSAILPLFLSSESKNSDSSISIWRFVVIPDLYSSLYLIVPLLLYITQDPSLESFLYCPEYCIPPFSNHISNLPLSLPSTYTDFRKTAPDG